MKGFLSSERRGEDNPNYKHGLSYASVFRQTREKLKLKKCKFCHTRKHLQVHHKDKNRANNKKRNYILF